MKVNESESQLADRFVAHSTTLRGVVRHTMVARQLDVHLPLSPARIVDVGGGAGHQAVPLARRGYEVTLLDPSETMLHKAQAALDGESDDVRQRVHLAPGRGEEASRLFGLASFDIVLCHGVLMYLEDPAPLISALVEVARPGGVVSILTKNADALAMRPALEGRYRDAVTAFDADQDVGGMGIATRAHTVKQLASWLAAAGAEIVQWNGVRVFTDHLGDQPPPPDLTDILQAESEAGRRDPYRSVARLIHTGTPSSGVSTVLTGGALIGSGPVLSRLRLQT